MSVNLSYIAGAGWQFFDSNGNPLSGGLLYTYQAGTSTPAATYTTSAGNIQNSNPIQLDADGRTANQVWLNTAFNYKFTLKTSSNVLLWTQDNIPSVVGSTALLSAIGASLVGYNQGSTNAITTTVQAKLQEFVSVKDFGAVGDGLTDDTDAFQAAVNYATYKAVYVPAGIYRLTDQISVSVSAPGGFNLIGDGRGVSVLKWDTSASGISITSSAVGDGADTVNAITISNLTFAANYNACGTAINITGPVMNANRTMPGAIIENCDFRPWTRTGSMHWTYGVQITANICPKINKCTFDMPNGTAGLHIYGTFPNAPTDSKITSCEFYFSADANILIEGAVEGTHIDDCTSVASETGIRWTTNLDSSRPWLTLKNSHVLANYNLDVDGGWQGIVTGNLFYAGQTQDPTYIIRLRNTQHSVVSARDPSQWIISNNVFAGNYAYLSPTNYGIYATELTESIISNNQFSLLEQNLYLGTNTYGVTYMYNLNTGSQTEYTNAGTNNSIVIYDHLTNIVQNTGTYKIGTNLDPYIASTGSMQAQNYMSVACNVDTSVYNAYKNGHIGNYINFFYNSSTSGTAQTGTIIGWISTPDGVTVTYNGPSDYRLKENETPITNSIDAIKKLTPINFTWKSNGIAGQGFIAHELQAVVPIAVSGTKDAVDENGKIIPQGVDLSKVVPLLTAAIKEQQATIESLKDRITALEAK